MASTEQLLDAALSAGHGEKVALITQEDARWTYAELAAAVAKTAAGLRRLGVRRGERVLLVLDNTPAFYAAFLGSMRIGAVPIPVNFLARAEDFAFFLDDAYASAAIVDQVFLDRLGPVAAARPALHLVVANGAAPAGASSLDAWLEGQAEAIEAASIHPDDPAFWLYSSGSTGRPKGVVHRHASLRATVERYARPVLSIRADDVVFSTTPLFHAYGLGNGLTFPLSVGATVVLATGRPTPAKILERVASHRPTLYFSVPALYAALLADAATGGVEWSSVRHGVSAAESLPADVARRFQELTGVEILDGIGSTEMLHIYCSNRAGAVRRGTSGTPVDGYRVRLVDPEGRECGDGEAGELWVEGPSALVGYWHQVDRTRAKLQGTWFATGDRYRRDEAGAYVYEGRVDDMMKIGGLWVSPIDIEARLVEHPAVREVAVVSVTIDERSRIAAHVILSAEQQGSEALVAELQAWCKAALQRYQFPHVVHFVDDLPRTSTGKIQRFRLRGA
ncbi:MAG: benzoate-CoA ligase family protein [Myxococcales bacterium]|nr:benzoate-CoA ligase family protein [Myxococcales bacterium]